MKKIILILIVISGINSFAQTPTQWLYKETVRSEFVDVIQTADGGYLSCGSRYNIDTNTLMGSILKFDTNGVIDWEQPYYTLPSCNSNTYDFEISKIKQSNDGNYYFVLNFLKRYLPSCQARIIKISAAGQYLGETLLPEIGYVEDFIVTNQNEFVYVSDKKLNKIDSSGNLLWSINPGVNFDSFYKIIKTVDGNYAITGQRRDTNLANNEDLAVVTIDSAGNILDTMRMNSSLVDSGKDIKQTPDGGFIVVGGLRGYFVPPFPSATNSSFGYNYYIIKLSASLDIEWQKIYGGSQSDYVSSVALTNDGGYVVSGTTDSMDRDAPWETAFYFHSWTVKLSQSGEIQWQKPFSLVSGENSCYKIIQSNDGGFVLVGYNGNPFGIYKYGLIYKFPFVPLSTGEFTYSDKISIYPNPAQSILNLRLSTPATIDNISVSDIAGKVILQQAQTQNQVNIENLASGIYFLEATANHQTYQTKFIKQ